MCVLVAEVGRVRSRRVAMHRTGGGGHVASCDESGAVRYFLKS